METLKGVKVASRKLFQGLHFWPLPRSCLEAKPNSLSPITENKCLFSSGGQRSFPHFTLVEKGARGSPDPPWWGESSLHPALRSRLWPWRVLLGGSWCSVFPEAGGGQSEEPGVGERLLGGGREGWALPGGPLPLLCLS